MIRTLIICATLWPALAAAQQASSLPVGDLRVLDKVTGHLTNLSMRVGAPEKIGGLTITMNDCRVPSDNPTGDAFAELSVTYRDNATPVFSGWMIASAPALNAMDHPRYDVWVMRCATN